MHWQPHTREMVIRMTRLKPAVALVALIIVGIFAATTVQDGTGMQPWKPSLSIIILSPQTVPLIDSSCLGASNSGSSNDCSITTTHSPDLIIVEIGTGASGSAISSISDTSGLPWKLYAHYTLSGTSGKSLFVYYAISSALLSSDKVTVSFTGSGNNGLQVIAVNNFDSTDPFDPSSSPAVSSSSTGSTSIAVSPVSTTNSDELLFGMFVIQSDPTLTSGSGFTALSHSSTPTVYAEYEQLSTPATGLSVGVTLSSAEAYLGTAFGVAPAPVSATSSTTITSSSTTKTTTTTTTTASTSTTSKTTTATTTTTTTSTTSGTTTTSDPSTTTTSTTVASTSTSLTVTATSTGNACFVNNYNPSIPVINAIYWECGAALRGDQSIKQNIFRSSELYGAFNMTITASQAVTVIVVANGVQVFSETGTNITYSGTVPQNAPLYVTISNSETTDTSYTLAIDWTGV